MLPTTHSFSDPSFGFIIFSIQNYHKCVPFPHLCSPSVLSHLIVPVAVASAAVVASPPLPVPPLFCCPLSSQYPFALCPSLSLSFSVLLILLLGGCPLGVLFGSFLGPIWSRFRCTAEIGQMINYFGPKSTNSPFGSIPSARHLARRQARHEQRISDQKLGFFVGLMIPIP